MYSIALVGRDQSKTLHKLLQAGDSVYRGMLEKYDLSVVPHPGEWAQSIAAIELQWPDAMGSISSFEAAQYPFVFEELPAPPLGALKAVVKAFDEHGVVLGELSSALVFEVVSESEETVEDGASVGVLVDGSVSANIKQHDRTPDGGESHPGMVKAEAAGSRAVDHVPGNVQSASPMAAPLVRDADSLPLAAAAQVTADTFSPIRIQAEDNDAGDGAYATVIGPGIGVVDDPSDSNTDNADGGAYIDYVEASGESLTFTFNVTEAGEYDLALGYALSQNDDGSGRNRPLRLEVNNELVDRMFDLRSTTLTADASDFSEFGEQTIRVQLQAGENTVSFTSNGASGPNIDYLEVRAPDPNVHVIQAEDMVLSPTPNDDDGATNRVVTPDTIADLTDGSETFRVGAEGTSYVDWAFGNAAAWSEFTLDVAVAGTYTVTSTYASSSARPLTLSLVDGGGQLTTLGSFNFAATAAALYYPDDVTGEVPAGNLPIDGEASEWEGWSTETIEVSLPAGSHTLRLGGGDNGPNIDKVEVALLAADPVDPTGPLIDPIVIQAEDALPGVDNDSGTLVRDAANPETGSGFQGLRPNYSGDGYLDFGSVPGDSISFTVNVAEAGSYDLNFRYASNGARPMELSVNDGTALTLAFDGTDVDGDPDTEGFDQWSYQTLSTDLQVGDNVIRLAIPVGAGSGPNIDRLEVTTLGSGPVGDVLADVEGDLVFSAGSTLINGANTAAADFNVTGLDDDVVYIGVSFDGGITVTEVQPDAAGDFSVDLSGQMDGDLNATFIVLDAFGNRAEQGMALSLDTTADEGGDLAITGPVDPILPADSQAVTFNLAGLDADIESAAVSFDGGVTRSAVGVDGNSLLLDLSAQPTGDADVTLYVVDAAGNEASASTSVVLQDDGTGPVLDVVDVTFSADAITEWDAFQDNPEAGTGVEIEDDGATLALVSNVWKRVGLAEDFVITDDTVLTLDLAASSSPASEIIAVGFDPDDSPFNGGNSVYQLGGTQTQGGFVDLRGEGVDNGDGTTRFTIDLSAHAGQTIGSLVFVNDDDIGVRGTARFSNVQLSSGSDVDTNQAPRVVGNGIADLAVAEGSTLEIDLPFVDDDGDDLTFSVVVTETSGNAVSVDGLEFDGLVLSGSLGDLAPGGYTVAITADDGQATATTDFALTVENVNDAPVAEPAALEPYFGQVGEAFIHIELAQFAPLFSDPDGDDLTLSAEDLPAGLEVVDGVIQGTPEVAGSFDIVVRATDAGGLSATQTLNFEIDEQAPIPSVIIEAEDFTDLSAANIVATGNVSASNEQLVRMISSEPATISTELDAAGVTPGWYTLRLFVYDETDGAGSLTLTIGDTVLEARNTTSGELESTVVLNDDFGTLVGDGARGNAGQSGNRKEIVFETPVLVTAGMLASLALQAEGGELMRIDSLVLEPTTAPNNSAPTLEGLESAVSVDENTTAVASLMLDDTDGDDLAVSLEGADAALFSYDADTGALNFLAAPDAELPSDADADGIYELTVVVSDGTTSVSQQTLISVTDLNESIAVAPNALNVAENVTEIGTIPVVDEDGEAIGLNAPVYAITGGVDAPLFEIDSDTGVLSFISPRDYELAVDADEDGVYEVEVSVVDGDLSATETLAVTVTDVDETGFTPISLQAEGGTITLQDDGSNATVTTVRDADNPETGSGFSGLRPDYSGTGYVDFGDTAGDALSFEVDVSVAGTYDLNIRYASNTARPLDLTINGSGAQSLPFVSTDPDGSGAEEGFDHWVFETVTVSLEAGSNTIALAIPPGASTGPNIDRIEITEAGSGPIPVDASADVDGNLALTAADDSLSDDQLASAMFNISGADDDIVSYAISLDGGTTRSEVTPDADGDVTLDLTGQSGSIDVMLIVTDAVGNEANVTESVTIDGVAPFDFVIEGEELVIDDPDNAGDSLDTQVRDPSNPETNTATGADGLWDGFTGTGYLDMGGDVGDAGSFEVSVDEAGTYQLTVRYTNGDGAGADRPMNILVDGASQGSLAFGSTGVGNPGWENWQEETIEVELAAGTNTIRLENLGTAGPNIDNIQVSRDGDVPPRDVEPGDRFSVKINFQPEGVAVPDGYVADTGKAFGTQSLTVDGQSYQYGWVTEASIADGTANGTIPLDISALTSVAVNDRTDDIAGLDPRQGTYAHFDQPSADYVRAGWEIELEDGYYEVTISIGDTSGPYDSHNVLNAEGELFNDPFTPFRPDDFPADAAPADDTEGARSDLVTRIVQVTDGRLTLDSMGLDNENTEIQYIEIQSLPDLTPNDDREAPQDYAFFTDARAIAGVGQNEVEVDLDSTDGGVPSGVDPTSDIFVGISVVDGRGGALLESLADGSIRLFETVSGEEVTFNANTTGGFDSLTISPSQALKPFTSYTLVIEGFQDRGPNDDPDAPTREFQKYTNTFVTGEEPEVVPRDVAFDDVVELDGAADGAFGFTSLEISADGTHMYVATIGGQLLRYDVDPVDGSLDNRVELSLPSDYFFEPGADSSNDRRGIIGLTVDPTDPNVLWITDNYPIPLSGRDNGVPDFSGRVTKITLDDGPGFSGVAEPYITGLPRSNGDHVTNSLEFRENPDYDPLTNPDAPTHLLYLIQGSNSAMGEPDSAWGDRPERLLNAAVLEIDPTRDAPPGGFDVTTEPLPDDGLNRRFADDDTNVKDDPIPMGNGEFLVFNAQGVATVQDADGNVLEDFYDPYADGAVLTIFATGARNAYDLVWHSNGFLYVPTNGSAAGGNVPDNPNTPEDERYTNVEKQDDYLFRISEDGYYGHPNPLRDEYILNGGNPTSGTDPNQVDKYPSGTSPEGTYDLAGVYSLGENRSPNGAVEYTSGIFGGNLQGNVLFTEYSGGDDIRSITLDANGNVIGDDVLRDVDGNVISYIDPLDIIENPATGQLYLLTLNRGNGQSQIIRLDPVPGGTVDPDPGTDDLVSILAVQAEDVTPDDGTAVSIATEAGAEIEIRDVDNPETNQDLPNGLRPGAYGVDGNTNGNDGVPGGYADFGATNVDFLTFTFDLESDQAGDSVLRIRYANGGDADRPLEVFVNNVSVGVVSFPPSSLATADERWADWLTVDIPAALVSGQNTIRLQATDNTGPNIDQLEVLQDPDSASGFAEYEAEGAQLDGPVVVLASDDNRNASGDGFVDFDGSGDQTITWTVDVDEAGSYEIGIRYALAATKADRPLGLTINGVDIGQVNFVGQSNAAEDDWFYQDVLVNLQPGSNTITVTAPDGVGPNIDLLRVPTGAADNFVPVYADVTDGSRIELESGDSARSINEVTADFYFSVDADGLYRLDLAANVGADDGGSLALTLNGQTLSTVAYPGAGDTGEEGLWVELQAGQQYNLRAVSAADGADDIDYLDVTPIAGNDNADIEVQSGDPAYFANRLHFNYLENNSASNPDRDFKESATVTISNSGSETLDILDAVIEGPFVLADPTIFDGLSLAAGASIEVEVLFDRDAYVAPTTDAGDGVFEGSIRLTTNDADSPVAEVHMAGFWQARDEGGWEPNVNEVWEVFGFGNRIDGLPTVDGGGNSVLNDFDLYRPVNDDEVLSRYWTLADGVGEAKITQLAAFHGGGGATLGIHNPGNKGQDIIFSNHAGDNNQSILPLLSNGEFATTNFEFSDIPSDWQGNGVFGFEVANLSTDPSLNPTGGGTPPADADGIERGYTVRMFRALDADGNVIPNTYVGIMDYTGINYDYNDNMFLIEGVSPVTGGDLTVINNDGVPADDRLVMSRIENPANAAQQVHDVATVTLRNDGFEDLSINSVEVSDPALFELVSAFDPLVLEPGQEISVEVRFIATDSDDGSLYEANLIINSSDPDEGEKIIELAGIAQGQSENGQEPTVQEIVNAFGYSTDVAQGQMNQGGLVEANGDEILAPYFLRADGASPIKITQLAAYHTQGDIARLFIHDVDSRNLDEIIAHDEDDGQTLLPRTLDNGNQLASISLDRDDPFGFFAEISGRQGYISWSDPDANLYEDSIDAIGNPGTNLNWDENDGHLIRVYVAKDAQGNVIPDTYIVIQDYAGVNYDYNDNIFLVENVTTYDPTGAEDADANGRVDLYDDDDGDGIPNFIDNPTTDEQTAFNTDETPWAVGADGLTLEAKFYDNGGQGVAYNDSTAAHQGAALRGDEAVDISFGTEAIGYVTGGEWVEYTLNVETAGTYTLSLSASTPLDGRSVTAAFEQGGSFYASQTVDISNTGAYTTYSDTTPLTFELEEGEQVLRLTFNVGAMDLASFSLDQVPPLDDEQQAFTPDGEAWQVGSDFNLEAVNYDEGGQDVAYNDADAAQIGTPVRPGDGVDIVGDGDAIGWVDDGEWVEYTLDIAQAGVYDLSFLSALGDSSGTQRTITASFNKPGNSPYVTSEAVQIEPTGNWSNFQPTSPTQVALEAGEQVLRLTFNGGSQDLASFSLSRDGQQAFNVGGMPWQVDADAGLELDAVLFDEGEQGESYNELSSSQLGSSFRDTPVDIVGQGEAIGWIEDGEWVEYTINVEQAGSHTLNFVTSNPNNGRSITASVEKNEAVYDQATTVTPNSGAWGTYTDNASVSLELEAGVQVLRLSFGGGSQDLASFELSRDGGAQANTQSLNVLLAQDDAAAATPAVDDLPISDDVGLQGVQADDSGSLI